MKSNWHLERRCSKPAQIPTRPMSSTVSSTKFRCTWMLTVNADNRFDISSTRRRESTPKHYEGRLPTYPAINNDCLPTTQKLLQDYNGWASLPEKMSRLAKSAAFTVFEYVMILTKILGGFDEFRAKLLHIAKQEDCRSVFDLPLSVCRKHQPHAAEFRRRISRSWDGRTNNVRKLFEYKDKLDVAGTLGKTSLHAAVDADWTEVVLQYQHSIQFIADPTCISTPL